MTEQPDYGSRIRAVCDYLETVPGDRYDFSSGHPGSLKIGGCGCVVVHGVDAGIIPRSKHYEDGYEWLGFSRRTLDCGTNILDVLKFGSSDDLKNGETGKQHAISTLRAYADDRYPLTATLA